MPPEDAIQVLSGHYVTYIIGVLSTTDVATVGAGDVSGAPTNRKAVLAACSIVRKIGAGTRGPMRKQIDPSCPFR